MIPYDKPNNNLYIHVSKPIERLNSAVIAVSFQELKSSELIAVHTMMASMISHKLKLRAVQMSDGVAHTQFTNVFSR